MSDRDNDGIPDKYDECIDIPEDHNMVADDDGCPESQEGLTTNPENDDTVPQEIPTDALRLQAKGPLPMKTHTPKATLVTKSAMQAWALPDGTALLNGSRTAWHRDAAGKIKRIGKFLTGAISLPKQSEFIALLDGKIARIDAVSGKTLAFAKLVGKPQESTSLVLKKETLWHYDGCRFVARDAKTLKVKNQGPKMCGIPLQSKDASVQLVWDRDPDSETVSVYRLESKKTPNLVLSGTGSAPGLSQLLLSPNGSHLCFSRNRDGSNLVCKSIATEKTTAITSKITDRRAVFAGDGSLLFAEGPRGADRVLIHANLVTQERRTLGTLGPKEKWLSPIGDSAVLASGGSRLLLFDWGNESASELELEAGEWEGLAGITLKPFAVFLGREGRGSRDQYLIEATP